MLRVLLAVLRHSDYGRNSRQGVGHQSGRGIGRIAVQYPAQRLEQTNRLGISPLCAIESDGIPVAALPLWGKLHRVEGILQSMLRVSLLLQVRHQLLHCAREGTLQPFSLNERPVIETSWKELSPVHVRCLAVK